MNIKIKQLIESTFTDVLNNDDHMDTAQQTIRDMTRYKYFPENKLKLRWIITDKIKNNDYDLNDIDVYGLTDLSETFHKLDVIENSPFKDYTKLNISKWDVSKCKNFEAMFAGASYIKFDLSEWDVSSGEIFDDMFAFAGKYYGREFVGIENWDVSNAKSMAGMFNGCTSWNQDISNWNVSNVKDFSQMFTGCDKFNCNLSGWNISSGEDFYGMFKDCKQFGQQLINWKDKLKTVDPANIVRMFQACMYEPEWYAELLNADK